MKTNLIKKKTYDRERVGRESFSKRAGGSCKAGKSALLKIISQVQSEIVVRFGGVVLRYQNKVLMDTCKVPVFI